jgi:hypothetical protein
VRAMADRISVVRRGQAAMVTVSAMCDCLVCQLALGQQPDGESGHSSGIPALRKPAK